MLVEPREVVISVPATSANLGAGFDALGIALELRDVIRVRITSGATTTEVHGEGADTTAQGENNLVVKAIRAGFDQLKMAQPALNVVCQNAIPHARGLGSSAAAAVGGLAIARELTNCADELDDHTLLQLATALEGHPDNAAAALVGGATLAWLSDGVARWRPLEIADSIKPVIFIPEDKASTARARATLPDLVPFDDAVFNLQRSAMMVLALKDPSLLFEATEDRLHQNYRAFVMEKSIRLINELREAGQAGVLSGAGPTVLTFTPPPKDLIIRAQNAGWKVSQLPLAPVGVRVEK